MNPLKHEDSLGNREARKIIPPPNRKEGLEVHFCNGMWSEWNHTKAVGHAAGRGRDIISCKMITPRWRKVFSSFVNTKLTTRAKKASDVHQFNLSLAEKEANAMALYTHSKEASLAARNPRLPVSPPTTDVTLTTNNSIMSTLSKPSSEPMAKKAKTYHQQNLVLAVATKKNPPEAERQLSLMINHFITANALPFHLSECPLLNRMLVLARNTNNSYKPPRKDEMSGALLDANYTSYKKPPLSYQPSHECKCFWSRYLWRRSHNW